MKRVLGVIDNHVGPVCLMGDLNATPLWPVYRMLAGPLRDGATDAGRSFPVRGATWPSPFPLFRIDHVLIRGLRVSRVNHVSVPGTGHRGLIAEVAFDPRNGDDLGRWREP